MVHHVIISDIIHNIIQPNVMLLGASGVVFAFILLASITGKEEGIPITLIMAAQKNSAGAEGFPPPIRR